MSFEHFGMGAVTAACDLCARIDGSRPQGKLIADELPEAIQPGDMLAIRALGASPCLRTFYLAVQKDENGLFVQSHCHFPRAYITPGSRRVTSAGYRARIIGVLKGEYKIF